MDDQTTPTNVEQEAADVAREGDPAPAPPEPDSGAHEAQDDDLAAVRREAAQRRRQLREVEQERDQLRARVDDHDRREVERIAGRTLADASDLWVGVELGELRDDDGALDTEKVSAAVDDLVKRKPHYRRPAEPQPDYGAGRCAAARLCRPARASASWSSAPAAAERRTLRG